MRTRVRLGAHVVGGERARRGGLAMHMGPDEDMAIPAPEEIDLTLCALCRAQFEEWLEDV